MNASAPLASPRFLLLLFAVGIATFVLHEAAHWAAGAALGHDMVATPNHVWSRAPMPLPHQMLVSAAGPLLTLLQALAGFVLVKRGRSRTGFALLYMAFFMRLLAAAMGLSNPNDEARISLWLGWGAWGLPLLVVGLLLALLVSASRRMRLRVRDHVACYLVASLAVSLIVGADLLFWSRS